MLIRIKLHLRHYVADQEVQNLVLRAHREKQLTYNAFERDITLVNFYFAESKVIQFKTDLRMTTIDFISSVCIAAFTKSQRNFDKRYNIEILKGNVA